MEESRTSFLEILREIHLAVAIGGTLIMYVGDQEIRVIVRHGQVYVGETLINPGQENLLYPQPEEKQSVADGLQRFRKERQLLRRCKQVLISML